MKVWAHLWGPSAAYVNATARDLAHRFESFRVFEDVELGARGDEVFAPSCNAGIEVLITTSREAPGDLRRLLSGYDRLRVYCSTWEVHRADLDRQRDKIANIAWSISQSISAYDRGAQSPTITHGPISRHSPWMHCATVPPDAGEHVVFSSSTLPDTYTIHEIRVDPSDDHESVVFLRTAQVQVDLGPVRLGAWVLYSPVALPPGLAWQICVRQPAQARERHVVLLGVRAVPVEVT